VKPTSTVTKPAISADSEKSFRKVIIVVWVDGYMGRGTMGRIKASAKVLQCNECVCCRNQVGNLRNGAPGILSQRLFSHH
jgi:hypothetical protein